MWTKTFASNVLRGFSEDRRRVISDWRIYILARRLARAENAPLPDEKKTSEIRSELLRRGDIKTVEGAPGIYVVDVPYANLLEFSEEQVVQEANPFAVFGFLTAMTHHGLTDLISPVVHVITSKNLEPLDRLPLGTTPDDWADDAIVPTVRRPCKLGACVISWTQLATEPGFGVTVGYSFGVPIYLTDIERTLLDATRFPDKSGGIAKVFQAWRKADDLNMDSILSYCERYNNQSLRQRVGFLLEKLGKRHDRLDHWKNNLQRGGSLKLIASNPYSNIYSTDWNISLNVPASTLAILEDDQ